VSDSTLIKTRPEIRIHAPIGGGGVAPAFSGVVRHGSRLSVFSPRQEPFPFRAARDLLGIVRALYASTPPPHAARRAALKRVGLELQQAMELALEAGPGTMGHAAAWARAERATEQLGQIVDSLTPLRPTVEAAVARVRAAPNGRRGRRGE
jgi:hypothetical protein